MLKAVCTALAKVLGKNPSFAPVDMVLEQLHEPRPLPMGRKDFEEWTGRIISGALVPNEDGLMAYHDNNRADITAEQKDKLAVFQEGQTFALADMIMHLGPTESHKPDAHFIHSLRKFAINQVADTVRREIHLAAKSRLADEEAKKKLTLVDNEKNEEAIKA